MPFDDTGNGRRTANCEMHSGCNKKGGAEIPLCSSIVLTCSLRVGGCLGAMNRSQELMDGGIIRPRRLPMQDLRERHI